MIRVILNNSTNFTLYGVAFFKKIFDTTLKTLRKSHRHYEVAVHLIGDQRMATLNRQYRGRKGSTDVLSFPLTENVDRQIGMTGDIMELGEIFISPLTATRRAKRENLNPKEKMKFLAVHGFLHILGYDHERSKKDERIMFKLQDTILSKL